jgi:hypothetical protein
MLDFATARQVVIALRSKTAHHWPVFRLLHNFSLKMNAAEVRTLNQDGGRQDEQVGSGSCLLD